MSRLLIVLLVLLTPGAVRAQNDTILSEKALEAGLQIQQVATDLPFPMGMVALDDGSILVATSPSESGNFYDSTGQILHLADSDGDGTFETVTAVATDLPGSLVALARHEDIVITTSAQGGDESLTFFRMSDDPNEPLVELDRMHFNFQGAIHQSYGLAVRNTPGEGDSFDVFFNIGAAGNDTAGSNVRASGPVSASLEPATIYMVTISDEDGVLEFTEPVLVATGLRNASALLFHPETGDLLIGENGIDGIENPIVSYSADELNVVEADAIGVEVIDFGFPDAYVDYATGEAVGDESDAVAFLPLEGDESEGVAGIALLPGSFPEPFNGALIAGFHGQFDLVGLENEENPVRAINLDSGDQFDLVTNDAPGIGHIDSMTTIEDTVYLADFCTASLTSSTGCGVIYRVTAASDE